MNGAEIIAQISKNAGADFLTCSPHGEIVDAASALSVVVDAAPAEMIFSATNPVITHGETPFSVGRPGIRPLESIGSRSGPARSDA